MFNPQMPSPHPKETRIIVALPAEAKPINHRFGLARDNRAEAFPLYRNKNTALVISGPGKEKAANATRWLAEYLPSPEKALWINVGIAGHPHKPVGEAILAERILDGSHEEILPAAVPETLINESAVLLTLDEPDFDYRGEFLIDMEGFGFFKIAVDFAPPEQVQCLKIVSDNRQESARNINAKMVRTLIEQNLEQLHSLIMAMGGDPDA